MQERCMNKPEQIQPFPVQKDMPFGYYLQEDEVSLVDLWQILVKQKKTLFALVALTLIAAFVYALVATPVYKAPVAVVFPPTESEIQLFNVQGVQEVSVNSIYDKFKTNLQSMAPRRIIFEKMDHLEKLAPDQNQESNVATIFERFSESISVTFPAKDNKSTEQPLQKTTISIESDNPVLAADIINLLAEETERFTTTQIISDIQSKVSVHIRILIQEINLLRARTEVKRLDEIERMETFSSLEISKINDKISSLRVKAKSERLAEIVRLEEADQIEREKIQDKIKNLRSTANNKRSDRIAKLKEGAAIARTLEIKEPIGYKLKKIKDSTVTDSQIFTNLTTNGTHLYTLGYEAIDAEITSLSERKTDEPFIPELRTLQDRLNLLGNNEKIAALKIRGNDDPFIPELRDLQDRLYLLDNNEKIAALKLRGNDDPFIPELRGLQEKLTLAGHKRETEQLKSRKNDDPYIASLRDKESQLAYLKSISIDPKTLKTARLDQAAFPSKQRIKPKRKLIVGLGLVLGLVLGVFGAFFAHFLETQRKQQEPLSES
jgi:LPS O-antigen subunit length determinant protein (WzzB/FepE family)